MPEADGLAWIARLRQRFPDAPLVVVSADERAVDVKALIELGVAGFIPKSDSAAVILQAVRLVLSGGTYVPTAAAGAVERRRAASTALERRVTAAATASMLPCPA